MTQFEFLTVAISIVLALGLVRLVDGLSSAIDPARRYWLHLAALGYLILVHLFFWWSLWIFRKDVSWDFGRFAFVILGALILYFQASAVIPRNPEGIASWKEHYFRIHRRLFLAALAYLVQQFATIPLFLGVAPDSKVAGGTVVGIALSLVGAFSESERVHACVGAAFALFVLFVLVTFGGGAVTG